MASKDTARREVADPSKQAASPATTMLQMNINAHDNNKKTNETTDLLWIEAKIEIARLTTCALMDNTDLRSSA